MRRIITEVEMESRRRMSKARLHLTDAMGVYVSENDHGDHLTSIEWCQVLNEMQQRMLQHGLKEFWDECQPSR